MVAQMQELISSNARAFEEIKRDVAELKLQQRNDHSVKAGPEADEEMLRRMCHGIVDNVAPSYLLTYVRTNDTITSDIKKSVLLIHCANSV